MGKVADPCVDAEHVLMTQIRSLFINRSCYKIVLQTEVGHLQHIVIFFGILDWCINSA